MAGVFCSAVFFVLCGSIFETIATGSCIESQLCLCEIGYASISPSMWCLVKHGVPILIVSATPPALYFMQLDQYKFGKRSVIRPLSNSGTNRPRVYDKCYSVKTAVLKLNPTPSFREWG